MIQYCSCPRPTERIERALDKLKVQEQMQGAPTDEMSEMRRHLIDLMTRTISIHDTRCPNCHGVITGISVEGDLRHGAGSPRCLQCGSHKVEELMPSLWKCWQCDFEVIWSYEKMQRRMK